METSCSEPVPLFGVDAARLGKRMVCESILHDTAQVVLVLRGKWCEDAIIEWLATPNQHLSGATPLSVIRSNGLPRVLAVAELAQDVIDSTDRTRED